jgi:hypothetical protein
MSSDPYKLRVLSVDGSTVRLEVRPTPAIGIEGYVLTRSFVLGVLAEIAGLSIAPQTTDQAWVSEHVGEYVTRTEVESLAALPPDADPSVFERPHDEICNRITLRAELASADLAAHFVRITEHATAIWDVWWNDPLRPVLPTMTPIV